jgi:hypothetical protein
LPFLLNCGKLFLQHKFYVFFSNAENNLVKVFSLITVSVFLKKRLEICVAANEMYFSVRLIADALFYFGGKK